MTDSNVTVNTKLFLSILKNADPEVMAKIAAGKNTTKDESNTKEDKTAKTSVGDTASKLGPLETDTEVQDILTKIYGFLKKSNENKIKLREIQDNYKEENEFEKEKRHKELLKAIEKIKIGGDTATKIEEDTGLGIFDIIENILNAFGGSKNALKLLGRMGGFFLTPFGAAFLGVTSVLTLLALDEKPEETNKMLQNAVNPAAEVQTVFDTIKNTDAIERRKQNLLADRPRSKKSYNIFDPNKDIEMQNQYLKEIGFDENTGLTSKEREQGFNSLDEKGNPIKKKLEPVTTDEQKSIDKTEVVEPATPSSPASVKKNESSSPAAPKENKTIPAEKTLTTNESVVVEESPTSSSRLNQVTSENLAAKLNETLSPNESIVVNNSVSSGKTTQIVNKSSLPSVRNLEVTYQRMIYDSTRVV
jgi:hypothetical protein